MPTASKVAIRWLGHSCVDVEISGTRILTDPALTPRLGHLRRHHLVEATAIEPPDVIVISHVHLDHLHLPSLARFDRGTMVIVPAGAGTLLRRRGFLNLVETRAGDATEVGAVTVETVPAGRW